MPTTETVPVEYEFTLTRSLDRPARIAFEAWTNRDVTARCCSFGGFSFSVVDSDLRPGGSFRHRMDSAGGEEFFSSGVFLEVVAPERIVSTSRWHDRDGNPSGSETKLTLLFEEQNGSTKLTLHSSGFATAAERDAVRNGMGNTIMRFGDYLAKL